MTRERTVRVFLSYAFTPLQYAYTKDEMLDVLEGVIEKARQDLRLADKNVKLVPNFAFDEYGRILRDQILQRIETSDIVIVDISDNNPNVLYELGYADAFKRDDAILIKSNKGEYKVPSDIRPKQYLEYDKISDVRDELAEALKTKINRILDAPLGRDELRNLWFPETVRTIHVIGPKSQARTEFSDFRSPNYDRLHKIGDKTAIIEISIMLARLYPKAKLDVHMAGSFDVESDLIKDNMVVVGGPGNEGEGNRVCRIISDEIKSKASYAEDCEVMLLGSEKLRATYEAEEVVKDYGYFGRMPNPHNSGSIVVLVHGIHTAGVVGAARAFSDSPNSGRNAEKVLDELGNDPHFECVVTVNVRQGVQSVPDIDMERLTAWKPQTE